MRFAAEKIKANFVSLCSALIFFLATRTGLRQGKKPVNHLAAVFVVCDFHRHVSVFLSVLKKSFPGYPGAYQKG